jgi:thymidylate synthase (FAD)
MTRPSVPEADRLIGVKRPVLSHGYVVLVDYMGNDAAIVQAARVSYGAGTKSVRDDRGLIRYLMRHRHTTPFEMVEFKFLARLPIYVARQWIRHRTACLSEGTRVFFDLPKGPRQAGAGLYSMPIEEIWQKFQPTTNRAARDQRNPYFRRDQLQSMLLRQLDEESQAIRHTRLVNVTRNGPKPVFRMTLDDGKSIDCTADHRFLFQGRWNTLAGETGLREEGGRAVWNRGEYALTINGAEMLFPALYQDRSWLEREYVQRQRSIHDLAEVCGVVPETIQAWIHRFGLPAPPHPTSRFRPGSTAWEGIGRWTTQIAPTIHARNHWTCQLCFRRKNQLHAHHIVPVWADLSKARDPSNLTTLCDECHREVHEDEGAYIEMLGGTRVEAEWVKKPRAAWNRSTIARTARIEKFEFLGHRMTYDLEVAGPFHNFVANGIVTHNSVNEYSARYSIVPDEYDVPPPEDVRRQSARNRQGRAESLPPEVTERFRSDLDRVSREAYDAYTRALDSGVARETARMLLPVSFYTQWYWKINLYNLFHFLSLRLDPHAQDEIRLYAAEMAKIAQAVCPIAFEAFEEFQLEGLSLSRKERRAIRSLLEGATPEKACAEAGLPLVREDGKPMTSGEGVEFIEKLERIRASS